MSDWPVGLSTGCFSQDSIFHCLETISRGGFNIIEICSFPAHLNYHDADTVACAARRIEELGMEAGRRYCDFCDVELTDAFIHGKTIYGMWANMCVSCNLPASYRRR
jgi:hypothetical protein